MFGRVAKGLYPHSIAAGLSIGLPSQSCRNFAVLKKVARKKNKQKKFPRIAVVLREDVHKLGVQGEEVLVKRGHARNDLLLKRDKESPVAVYATPENRRLYKTVFPDQDTSTEALADGLEQEIILNLTNRSVPFYSLPDEDDRTNTAKPVILTQIHNGLMSKGGLSWLFLDQISLLSERDTLSKFGKYRLQIDLAAGPLPVGSTKTELVLDVRLKEAAGLSAKKLGQQEAAEQAAKSAERVVESAEVEGEGLEQEAKQ